MAGVDLAGEAQQRPLVVEAGQDVAKRWPAHGAAFYASSTRGCTGPAGEPSI
jgi:hypothetical protein